MRILKILIVIGTRPEAIKMAPLIRRLKADSTFDVRVCNTGQHKDLLDPILSFFNLNIDYSLNIMTHNQGLPDITSAILLNIKPIYEDFKPDYVLVHGDTTTSFSSSLSAFYCGIKVAHVEAGLRTGNKLAPFPEEMNRSLTAQIANVHFAPTKTAARNLSLEGITKNVHVTGNTVIDALFDAVGLVNENTPEINSLKSIIETGEKIILFTGHRRENFGDGFASVFSALKEITDGRDDLMVIYPVHPNPNVKLVAEKYFKDNNKIRLINPLGYDSFIWLMQKSFMIFTDSGGIQEEAPSLGKPVLVLREVTERPEAVEAGTVIIVGTDKEKIKKTSNKLLNDAGFYDKMSSVINPYGDGKACEKIITYFKNLQND